MVVMTDTATVTSKKMVTIPARIRKKYGLHEGRKVRFVELEGNLVLVPVMTLKELHGIGREHIGALKEAVKELDQEHRLEATADA